MILQRLASAIRNQNWSQIIIEILIVVIGIFLGLQVQAWYDDRAKTQQEKAIIATLRNEVDGQLADKHDELNDIKVQYSAIESSLTILFERKDVATLSETECNGVWMSHILEWNYVPLVSLDELIASGKLDFISDEALRLKLIEYSSKVQAWTINASLVRSEANKIVDDYPQLLVRSWKDNLSTVSCKLDQMRTDQHFLNELQSNHGRMGGLLVFTQTEINLLNELKQLLTINDRDNS